MYRHFLKGRHCTLNDPNLSWIIIRSGLIIFSLEALEMEQPSCIYVTFPRYFVFWISRIAKDSHICQSDRIVGGSHFGIFGLEEKKSVTNRIAQLAKVVRLTNEIFNFFFKSFQPIVVLNNPPFFHEDFRIASFRFCRQLRSDNNFDIVFSINLRN